MHILMQKRMGFSIASANAVDIHDTGTTTSVGKKKCPSPLPTKKEFMRNSTEPVTYYNDCLLYCVHRSKVRDMIDLIEMLGNKDPSDPNFYSKVRIMFLGDQVTRGIFNGSVL